MAQRSPIRKGEMFIRPEASHVVWKVKELVEMAGLPQHVQLESRRAHPRKITLSEAALRDRRMWISLTSFDA